MWKVDKGWHLTHESRINVWMNNKPLCRPGVSELINLIPNHHQNHQVSCSSQIQSWQCHWVEPRLEKKTPPCHVGKAEGSGDSLPSSQSFMPHHVVGMARGQLIEYQKVPPIQSSGGAATRCIPGVGLWPSLGCTYACHVYAPKGCIDVNPNGSAPTGEYGIQHGTWKQKT